MTTTGVVMKVRTRGFRTNMENRRWKIDISCKHGSLHTRRRTVSRIPARQSDVQNNELDKTGALENQ